MLLLQELKNKGKALCSASVKKHFKIALFKAATADKTPNGNQDEVH